MIEIKDLNMYNQYDERGVKEVKIVKDYVIVNNKFKCRLTNFTVKGSDVFIFGRKVSTNVARLFIQATSNK